ncbi:MAG: ATP-binding protein [Thermodesulfobacteriota bacterium]
MTRQTRKIPPRELSSRLQRLMFLRVLIVSLLLGASLFLQAQKTSAYFGDIQTSHYVLISAVYFLTFIYIILLKRMRNLSRLAYAQLLIDTLLVTAFIYATGGIESFFSFLYILAIISASMLLYRRGGLIVASSSSILYGTLLDLHYYQVIIPCGAHVSMSGDDQGAYILFRILAHTAAFYLVAMLSSYLSEQTRISRDELEAKKVDISKLEILNERIVQSMTSGLITVDDDRRIILFNPAAEVIFGIQASEVNGRKIDEPLPFLKDCMDPKALPRGGRPVIVDIPYRHRDGRELFLRATVSPLSMPGGNAVGRILIFQDLTEIRRIEKEMQRVEGLAMVGELASGIAHEIRNPMASISGSIQVLKEGMDLKDDDVSGRLMDIVVREVNRLNHLVSNFLQYARPPKTRFRRFELNKLILDSLDLFRYSGGETDKIRVVTRFEDPIHMESDPEQIKQVIWNILLNARDAMPGGGTLYLETRVGNDQGAPEGPAGEVELIVRDTGTGFTLRALENLFTPFFTTKSEGSGLGLATVKRIMEGLQGRVRGENHPEGGARIILKLPLPAQDKEIS